MSGKKTVSVFGSVNVDLVSRVERLPRPGETVAGGDFSVILGGKGANQAIAAARAGGDVRFFGAVGAESFGLDPVRALSNEGIDVGGIAKTPGATGAATIAVDEGGENMIVVSPGANARAAAPPAIAGGIHVAQLELPPHLVRDWFREARASGGRTLLNAAPAIDVPGDLFAETDILIVNETELARYAGVEDLATSAASDVATAARRLIAREDQIVVVTLGGAGAVAVGGGDFVGNGAPLRIRAYDATPVDTTGAGDCFCGVFAARLAAGRPVDEALEAAAAAAAISVERPGASQSAPTAREIEEALSGRARKAG